MVETSTDYHGERRKIKKKKQLNLCVSIKTVKNFLDTEEDYRDQSYHLKLDIL